MFLSPKSPLFLLLVATPLMLGNPATRAAEGIAHNRPVLAHSIDENTAREQMTEADRLYQLGIEQTEASQFEEALQSLEAALEIYHSLHEAFPQESLLGEANTLYGIGNIYRFQGDKYYEYYQDFIEIIGEIGNPEEEIIALNKVGDIELLEGDNFGARRRYEDALEIAQTIGDSIAQFTALNNVGNTYQLAGDYDRSRDYYQQALAIAGEIDGSSEDRVNQRTGEAITLNNLGEIYRWQGNYREALNYFDRALTIARDIGNSIEEAIALGNLGTIDRL